MASELRVNTLKDASGNNSVATSVVFNGTAKAWGSYQMNSSNAINDSYNVSSQTDTATGHSTIAWTSSMQTGYAVGNICSDQCHLCANQGSSEAFNTAFTSASAKFSATTDSGTDIDSNVNGFVIFGDLA